MTTVAAASLTGWHLVALPITTRKPHLGENAGGEWLVRHYLSSECACSRAVAAYLAERGPVPRAVEQVVVIRAGNSRDDRIETALGHSKPGSKVFQIRTVTAEQAAQEGVEGVPILEIVAPWNQVVYRGGHQRRGSRPGVYEDISILSGLMDSREEPALPVLGCATSKRLRALFDPLGLKSMTF